MVHFRPSSSKSAQYYGHEYILLISVQNEKFCKRSRNEPKITLWNITQDWAASMKICTLDNYNAKCELLPTHTCVRAHTHSPTEQTENISYKESFYQLDSTEII
jgi:hypothetical protein